MGPAFLTGLQHPDPSVGSFASGAIVAAAGAGKFACLSTPVVINNQLGESPKIGDFRSSRHGEKQWNLEFYSRSVERESVGVNGEGKDGE